MTDNEIVQALDCCAFHDMTCRDCPYAGCFTRKFCERELHIDALNLIKRQQAEIERLKEERDEMHQDVIAAEEYAWKMRESKLAKDNNVPTKWISVKDRLPEIDQPCLCYKKRNGHTCYQLGTYIGVSFSKDCAAFKSMSHYGCIGVTHWMPLPLPPKGE